MASTVAPDRLKQARAFLLEHLDINPGRTVSTDLDPAEVGIVGDAPHAANGSSYHLGKGQLRSDSYTIVESSRDRNGLSNAASGLDIGDFAVTVAGKRHTLRSFSVWLVAQCKAGAPDTRDIREVIYSPDGETVKRWDRLGRRSTGDNSHLWHTHISYFRDSEHRDKTGLFRRYLTEIGLLEDDDMLTAEEIARAVWAYPITDHADKASPQRKLAAGTWLGYSDGRHNTTVLRILDTLRTLDVADDAALAELRAQVLALPAATAAALASAELVDEDAVAAQIVASLPAGLAEQVAQKLAERLAA